MKELTAQLLATSPWEAAAAALGLAYLLLAVRRNLLCWLCAFVSTGIYLALFARAALYMHSLLQVFYLAMAVYGFLEWRKGRTAQGEVLIRCWSMRRHALAWTSIIAATLVNGWLLSHTDAAAPYIDSFVTWGSVVTTWMVARRVIENWLYWIVFDSVAAWLYFTQGLVATTLLFIVYLGIVVRGYIVWRGQQRAQQAALQVGEPGLEERPDGLPRARIDEHCGASPQALGAHQEPGAR